MTNAQGPEAYAGKTVVDTAGDKIGTVEQVYINDTTGAPDWITIKTGLFGKDRFAPLHGSSFSGDDLALPYGKDVVKDSPSVTDTDHLDNDESDALFRYYQQHLGAGSSYDRGSETDYQNSQAAAQPVASGNDSGYLTRSEEQLHVGTEKVEAGRAGIRKYVVTEQQTVNVPVSHDEVRVIREPLQAGDSVDGATIGEDAVEVTLMEDQVHVDKQVVGVEKVRLATETVTDQQAVNEEVRKEQIETTGVTTADGTVPAQAGGQQ
ncbi:uncharacterized protein (TIGR02271 family) [Nakamurella sp. UYEF19]|uniref:PRC and DUF2382 domain-containing protein n=1 Tax=Nakamurella sp. UYEF19 TaxID=1756392 RepID=UPI003397B0EE